MPPDSLKTQNSSITSPDSIVLPYYSSPSIQSLGNHCSVLHHYSFVFSRMSWKENPSVITPLRFICVQYHVSVLSSFILLTSITFIDCHS